MEDRFAQIRIREQLNALHAKLFLLELDIKVYPGKDKYARSPQELKKSQDREYFTRRKRLDHKFARLMAQKQKRPALNLKLDAVVNLSSKKLSEDETIVLARGFKFRPTLQQLPIKDIIIGTETLIKTAGIKTRCSNEIAEHDNQRNRVDARFRETQTNKKEPDYKRMESSQDYCGRHIQTSCASR